MPTTSSQIHQNDSSDFNYVSVIKSEKEFDSPLKNTKQSESFNISSASNNSYPEYNPIQVDVADSNTITQKRTVEDDNYNSSSCKNLKSEESSVKDEFSLFGEYVAQKLRNMSNKKIRLKTTKKINDILFEAECELLEDEVNPS